MAGGATIALALRKFSSLVGLWSFEKEAEPLRLGQRYNKLKGLGGLGGRYFWFSL